MINQEGITIELQKKSTENNLREGNRLFDRTPSFLCYSFVALYVCSPSQETYLLNGPIKIHNIAMGGIPCYVKNVKISFILILAVRQDIWWQDILDNILAQDVPLTPFLYC